jgi:hypothetical protein
MANYGIPTSRAIFHSALVLLLFLDSPRVHDGPYPPPLIVDPRLNVDWPLLAQVCSNMQGMVHGSDPAASSQRCQSPSAIDYLTDASFGLGIQNFTEGKDSLLDCTR